MNEGEFAVRMAQINEQLDAILRDAKHISHHALFTTEHASADEAFDLLYVLKPMMEELQKVRAGRAEQVAAR